MNISNPKKFRTNYATRGMEAIREEFTKKEDVECLNYILNEEAGSSKIKFKNGIRDCDEKGKVLSSRLTSSGKGMVFADFVAWGAKRGLEPEHVLALRLYSTNAYLSINNSIRDEERRKAKKEYPYPVTLFYIDNALDKLKNSIKESKRHKPLDLWRGMNNLTIPDEFLQTGGAELAPMSTTTSLEVALKYAFQGPKAFLFLVRTRNYLDRGADISWLSCFPQECEYLYRPITTLVPRKNSGQVIKYDVTVDNKTITVIEVDPMK